MGSQQPVAPNSPFNPTLITILTAKQRVLINKLKAVLPPAFLAAVPPGIGQDIRVLGMLGLAISDINNAGPRSNFNVDSFPVNQYDFLILATSMWVLLFEMAKYTLADVSYNENGYTINLSRTEKLGSAFDKFKDMYETQLWNYKAGVLLSNSGVGLATPRFQSSLSRFISILGNGAFGWNIP